VVSIVFVIALYLRLALRRVVSVNACASATEGTPAIATDVGEIRSMLQKGDVHAGIVLQATKRRETLIKNLVCAIISMTDDEFRSARRGDAEQLGKVYDMNDIARQYLSIYSQAGNWMGGGSNSASNYYLSRIHQMDWVGRIVGRGDAGKTADSYFHPSPLSGLGCPIPCKRLVRQSKLACRAGRAPFHPGNPGLYRGRENGQFGDSAVFEGKFQDLGWRRGSTACLQTAQSLIMPIMTMA
jgi:hypothetical protein